jgi:photoactive yellow protein
MRRDRSADFGEPDLAKAVERLSSVEIDALPFGAVRLDARGTVTFYSASERRMSGFRGPAVGLAFFSEMAPCMDTDDFRGRVERARAEGRLDVSFGYVSDMPGGARDVALHVRVQPSSDGGIWIFLRRDGGPRPSRPPAPPGP